MILKKIIDANKDKTFAPIEKPKRARLKSASSKIAITAEKSNTLCTLKVE